MCGKGSTTSTSTNTANPQALAAYDNIINTAQNVYNNTPYTPYAGELTAGLNSGQVAAIQGLNGNTGLAGPYVSEAQDNYTNALSGLGAVQPYLQAGSEAAASGLGYQAQAAGTAGSSQAYVDEANLSLGEAAGYGSEANNTINPNQTQAYMNPYTQSVVNSTMAEAQQSDAEQQQSLASQNVAAGDFGSDRAGIASSSLAGQQDMANNQTIAGLNQANYAQAVQTQQGDAQIESGLAAQAANQASGYNATAGNVLSQAGVYGNLANSANSTASMYNTLGQLQGQTAQAYGTLGQTEANTGFNWQQNYDQSEGAALQASTVQQQTQTAQDAAAYGQYQNAQSYPFQQTGWLANIDEGIGSSEGSSTATTSPYSYISQAAGLGTAALGTLGATGAFGSSGWLTGLLKDGGPAVRDRYATGGATDQVDDSAFSFSGTPGQASGSPGNAGLNIQSPGLRANPLRPVQPVQSNSIASPSQSSFPTGGLGGSPSNTAGTAGGGMGSMSTGTTGSTQSSTPDDNSSRNAWMGLAAAGFGMMANSTQPGLGGIGAGALEGMREYQSLQQADRQNQVAQADIAYKNKSLTIDQQRVDQEAERLIQQAQVAKQNADANTAKTAADIQTQKAGLVTMTPLPYGTQGNPTPVYQIMDRRDPSNPQISYRPMMPQQPGQGAVPTGVAPATGSAPAPATDTAPAPGLHAAAAPAGGVAGQAAPPAPVTPAPTMAGPLSTPLPTVPATPVTSGAPNPNTNAAAVPPSRVMANPNVNPSAQQNAGQIDYTDPKTPATTTVPAGFVPANQWRLQGGMTSPEVAKNLADEGGKYAQNLQDAADKANAAQMRISEMKDDASNLPNTGLLTSGQFGTERMNIAKGVQAIGATFGLNTDGLIDPSQSASAQDLAKNTMRLGAELMTSTNGAREAGFILQKSIQNTGGIDNTKAGLAKIFNGYDAANRYIQDKASFVNDYYEKYGSIVGADEAFKALNPPQRYVNQALQAGAAAQQQAQATDTPAAPAGRSALMTASGTPPTPAAAPSPPIQAVEPSTRAAYQNAAPQTAQPQGAPVAGARQAPDGNWYVSDPNRPGKYLQVTN